MIRILEAVLKSPQSFWENEHQKEEIPTVPYDKPGSPCNARFLQGYLDEPVGHNETPDVREAEESVAENFSRYVLSGWLELSSRSVWRQWAVQTSFRYDERVGGQRI
jgi:hypothetical protein